MAWYDRVQGAAVGGFQGGAAAYGFGLGPYGIAAGVGFGILQSLLSPTEHLDLARAYERGEIPQEVEDQIVEALAGRFDMLRSQQGADLARRGITESSAAGRAMAQTYDAERDALADALAGRSLEYQKFGMDIIARRNQDLAQGLGSAASVIAHKQLLEEMKNRPGLGGSTPSTAVAPDVPVIPDSQGGFGPLPTLPNPTAPQSQGIMTASRRTKGRTGIGADNYASFSNVNSNFSKRQPITYFA